MRTVFQNQVSFIPSASSFELVAQPFAESTTVGLSQCWIGCHLCSVMASTDRVAAACPVPVEEAYPDIGGLGCSYASCEVASATLAYLGCP